MPTIVDDATGIQSTPGRAAPLRARGLFDDILDPEGAAAVPSRMRALADLFAALPDASSARMRIATPLFADITGTPADPYESLPDAKAGADPYDALPDAPSTLAKVAGAIPKAAFALNKGIASAAGGLGTTLARLSDIGPRPRSYREHVREMTEAGELQTTPERVANLLDLKREAQRGIAMAPGQALEQGAQQATGEWDPLIKRTPGYEAPAQAAEMVGGILPYVAEAAIPVVGQDIAVLHGAASTGGNVWQQAFDAFKAQGLSDEEARTRADASATSAGLGAAVAFRGLPGAGNKAASVLIGKRLATQSAAQAAAKVTAAAAETGGVMAAQKAQELLDASQTYRPDLSLDEAAGEIGKAFLSGAAAGGVMHAPGAIAEAVHAPARPEAQRGRVAAEPASRETAGASSQTEQMAMPAEEAQSKPVAPAVDAAELQRRMTDNQVPPPAAAPSLEEQADSLLKRETLGLVVPRGQKLPEQLEGQGMTEMPSQAGTVVYNGNVLHAADVRKAIEAGRVGELFAGRINPDDLAAPAAQEKTPPPAVPGGQTIETRGAVLDEQPSAQAAASPEPAVVPAGKPAKAPGFVQGTAAEQWADRLIAEARKRMHTGLDPELLAAYAVKGAALLEGGIRDFAAWSAEMVSRHGENLRPYLRQIYDQAREHLRVSAEFKGGDLADAARALREQLDAYKARGQEPPPELLEQWRAADADFWAHVEQAKRVRGGIRPGVRAVSVTPRQEPRNTVEPSAKPFAGDEKLPSPNLRDVLGNLDLVRQRLAAWWRGGSLREHVSYLKDAADNRAAIFGRQAGQYVRHELNRAFGDPAGEVNTAKTLREAALTFVIEADGNRARLADFHQVVAGSIEASKVWGRRGLKAIELAEAHWDRLQPIAELYRRVTEAEREMEINGGLNTPEWESGYVYHAQDVDADALLTGSAAGGKAGTPFMHLRDWPTYAEAIANGVKPRSISAVDLLNARLASGQRALNQMVWLDSLRKMTDPSTQQPLVTDLVHRARANGTIDTTAPAGYSRVTAGSAEFALLKGYEGTFRALTNPSWWREGGVRTAIQKGVTTAKHITLLFDTFHLGRLALWKTFLTGSPSYRRGLTLLDNTAEDIRQMAQRGEIPASWVNDLVGNRRKLSLALETGFNVAGIADNLHAELLQQIPVTGTFNRWLFSQYQRGAMSEAWLIEFERMKKMLPNLSEQGVARRVSRDLNARFGSLGSQGIFRSKTAQDFARLVYLAPQWNESLIRSELGALKQLATLPAESLQQRRLVAGTLLRAVGGLAVMQFVANQIINYATRGKPTWDNQEEGVGAKLSGWVPDVIGNGPGFFIHPLGVAAEISHLAEAKVERAPDVYDAVWQMNESRFNGLARSLSVWARRKDALGRKLRGSEVLPEMGKALVPAPIASSALVSAGRQLATGEHSERFAGQFQKQLMASVGIKTDQAPSPEQRMTRLAQEFKAEHGVPGGGEFPHGDFEDLDSAVRRGNRQDMTTAMAELANKRTLQEIYRHYRRWAGAPFTGSQAREGEFLIGLNAEQRKTYDQARDERVRIVQAVADLLGGN
jgi:hypothetical protein